MSRRPEILFPLFADVVSLPKIGPKTALALEKIGITRKRDLLFTLPHNLLTRTHVPSVRGLKYPELVTVEVLVKEHHPNTVKNRPFRVTVTDAKIDFQLVFFHAHKAWIKSQLPIGERRLVSGKVEAFDGVAQIVHPDFIERPDDATVIPTHEAVYPLTAGVTQRVMQAAAAATVLKTPDIEEWIDSSLLKERNWPDWKSAIEAAHNPKKPADISFGNPARERLSYDELLAHQVTLALARANSRKKKGISTVGDGEMRRKILAEIPFEPTQAQLRAVNEIELDLKSNSRMNRLLQGDVGSGKTLVAILAMAVVAEAGAQAVMMAPTEVLARQHFASLEPLCKKAGIALDFLAGSVTGRDRQDRLEKLENGSTQILIGTHSVFQQKVVFKDLRFAIIDEQHRFGVRQRMELGAKGVAVDILVMTATPIPRSLSLAQFGDMDVSVLDEKPGGRLPIETVLISDARLEEVVARLKSAIAEGKQAYWVCPLVEESEVLDFTAVEDRARALRVALGDEYIGMVHGRMVSAQKDIEMAKFKSGETKILVATTVIEVGVDVPNASIIMIEGAEKFGLAQLHQLRGRVGRGSEKSSCLLMYSAPLGEVARQRLEIMRKTDDGFVIAEEDLRLRGAGDVLGLAQSGLPRFQIADLETQTDLMRIAHDDARMFLLKDPSLETERGEAVRTLLYLMDKDQSIRLITVG